MKMLAASLVAHALVITWLVFPDPLEQLVSKPAYVLAEMLPPSRCPDYVWIKRQSGCVVTLQAVCRRSLEAVTHEQVERDHPALDYVYAR
jgi:hypothetical protein